MARYEAAEAGLGGGRGKQPDRPDSTDGFLGASEEPVRRLTYPGASSTQGRPNHL